MESNNTTNAKGKTMTKAQQLLEKINRIECWHRRNGRPAFGAVCYRRWEAWRYGKLALLKRSAEGMQKRN